MNSSKIVTRFAPSPTGFMHVGGARTALYAYLFAKQNGGTFILRFEDTDKEREVEGSKEHIIRALSYLGLTWDEGPDIGGPNAPYIQSQRLDTYIEYAKKLIEKGLAYADPYTEEEVQAMREKAEEAKVPFLYRNFRPENPPAWDGTQPLRLKIVNPKTYNWHDVIFGDLSAPAEALDDVVLIKSDGYPTYTFAHIIDDLYMGVTHIMRSDEFISSMPKFLSIYDALEITPPVFATLAPIMGPDGKKKLGKRDGAKDLLDYQKDGFLPAAMMNFLAFIGWSPEGTKEVFTPEDLIKEFSIERIHVSGGKLNEEKLLWFNKEHIKLLSEDEQKNYIRPSVKSLSVTTDAERIERSLPIILERISVSSEVSTYYENGELKFLSDDIDYVAEDIVWKDSNKEDTIKHLEMVIEIVTKAETVNESVEQEVLAYATEQGKGNVLWPLRYLLSGSKKSPDPFTLMRILQAEEVVKRVKKGVNLLN